MSEGISYTIKELLSHQDRKLDRILEKMDDKADIKRVSLAESRIAELEQHGSRQAIQASQEIMELEKRLLDLEKITSSRSHLVNQYEQDHSIIERLDRDFQRFQNGLTTNITKAISENNNLLQSQKDRLFTKREKVLLGSFAAIGAFGTLVSVVVLLIQVGH